MIDPDLLEQIYDVVLGNSSWGEAMARLRASMSSDHAMLMAREAAEEAEAIRYLCPSGCDESVTRAYADYYGSIDPYVAAIRSGAVPSGRMAFGDDVIPGKILSATEYYQDWLRPNDMRYMAGGYILNSRGIKLLLGVPRSAAAGPFTPEEIRTLQVYFDHIGRALEIQSEIQARTVAPDFDRIAARYGLTRAEARLVELLVETGSLKKSAQRVERSYHTMRAQLREVLQKTETKNQVQLMRLIHRAACQ